MYAHVRGGEGRGGVGSQVFVARHSYLLTEHLAKPLLCSGNKYYSCQLSCLHEVGGGELVCYDVCILLYECWVQSGHLCCHEALQSTDGQLKILQFNVLLTTVTSSSVWAIGL